MVGESGAPLHLKIIAYHVDIVQNEARRPGLKLPVEDIGSVLVVPQQSYIKRIDADGTRPFEDVRAQVRADAIKYFNLVLGPTSVKGRAKAANIT